MRLWRNRDSVFKGLYLGVFEKSDHNNRPQTWIFISVIQFETVAFWQMCYSLTISSSFTCSLLLYHRLWCNYTNLNRLKLSTEGIDYNATTVLAILVAYAGWRAGKILSLPPEPPHVWEYVCVVGRHKNDKALHCCIYPKMSPTE